MGRHFSSKPLRVAMIAPPWLKIPPEGYGGIENVLTALLPELVKLGTQVELFSIMPTRIRGVKNHWIYREEQYKYIQKPTYESLPIVIAQTAFALNEIEKDGGFDIIHSHNGFIDPFVGAFCRDSLPPILHTLHGPPFSDDDRTRKTGIPDNIPMWNQLSTAKRLRVVGISSSMTKGAPRALKKILLKPVYNAIEPSKFPFQAAKKDYFITLARSSPDKGQGIAARLCDELGYKLKLAGLVCDITSPKQLMLELANPLSQYRGLSDFRYFSDKIFPYLEPGRIEYIGDLKGNRKLELLKKARALLFPIQWEEPFGMAPIEALACGTPVIAMARGALPEIIKHGYNGFLANSEAEFKQYLQRIDEIDPANCRKSVEDKFSAKKMAETYLDRYYETIEQVEQS